MTETIVQQLIFTLGVAREMASWESPDYDFVILLIQQALRAAEEEALRHGIVTDFDVASEHQQ